MKRYSVLLGHADGELSTPLDLSKIKNFLMSAKGGAWFESEIFCKTNISYKELISLIAGIKASEFDYVFFYFSGHGGYKRNTIIELNPKGETIAENFLSKLAVRQLSIYDCCRLKDETLQESMESTKNFSALREDITVIRFLYEKRIMSALPQQMTLYSCRVDESSYDFGEGGIYTTHLLKSAKNFSDSYLLASQAHADAYQPTIDEADLHGESQHPDFFMPKYSSSQQLIFAINDKHTRS
ncbi:caspase family protein [Treponema sp.]|uniref:caspase family protein n=1 Tax=Treponema sp. TaxID=166 RepID=UPI003F0CE2D6